MSERHSVPDERAGILLAASAYAAWGILPIYWHMLDAVSPFELTACRITFAALCAAGVTLARGRLSRVITMATTPAVLRNLAASAALIAVNWTTFVYSVSSNQLVESSLGYYILPLLLVALGVVLFGERLSRVRLMALGLAGIAVTAQAVEFGHVPWIALVLALSFGFYGYMRKLTPVDPLDGLLIELSLLLPVALGVIVWFSLQGRSGFGWDVPTRDIMLLATGPITATPLSLFAAGARRIRLSTLGFVQYLSPSITLVIAVLLYGEPFSGIDAVTFGCVWTALAIVASEGQWSRLRVKALAGE
jgi:chloramphenicol-sensitive protein RarD